MDDLRDKLTGLLNRRALIEKASLIISDNEIAIAIGDVDFFINIDSKLGSNEGDCILKNIANFLSQNSTATVGRYGGDEFLFIFKGLALSDVEQELELLRSNFRKQRFISDESGYGKVPMTMSFGVAHSRVHSQKVDELLKYAEIALLSAKKKKRNMVEAAYNNRILIQKDTNQPVYTIAGAGLKGFEGDGKPAKQGKIAEPYGVDIGKNGELIFADRGNHAVRYIKDGIMNTLAGGYRYGFYGDGGQASGALLNKPSGVAVGAEGDIFIADTGNNRIRKIDKYGRISTVAGNGNCGYSGDGGYAIDASLNRPGGVAVDGNGNIYTNDYGNNVIRMISKDGYIETVAGNGSFGYDGDGGNAVEASLNKPYGMAVSRDGTNLYIADYGNHCIRLVCRKNNTIHTLCGTGVKGYTRDGGKPEGARLNSPFWVSVSMPGYLLIADGENHCIRAVDFNKDIIFTLIGSGRAGYCDTEDLENVCLFIPAGMVYDPGKKVLYIADYGNNSIRVADLAGVIEDDCL